MSMITKGLHTFEAKNAKDIYRNNIYDLQKQLQESYVSLKEARAKIYQLQIILETFLERTQNGSQFPTRSTNDK